MSDPVPTDFTIRPRKRRRSGFLLLETMIGVALFAFGIIALARCVNQCLVAEAIKNQDQVAKLALENRMAEIEAGAVLIEGEQPAEKMKGMFSAITLKQSRRPAMLKNEHNEELNGVYLVTLEALWHTPDGDQAKELTFYAYHPQNN